MLETFAYAITICMVIAVSIPINALLLGYSTAISALKGDFWVE